MLQRIRRRTQGILSGVILSLIVITFAMCGLGGLFQKTPQRVAAWVGKKPLSWDLVEAEHQQWQRLQGLPKTNPANTPETNSQLDPDANPSTPGTLSPEALSQAKRRIQRTLAEHLAVLQGNARTGFQISDTQVMAYLRRDARFQDEQQHFSLQKYHECLAQWQISEAQLISGLRNDLLIAQPLTAIMTSSFALPGETEQWAQWFAQTRDIGWVIVPFQRYRSQVSVSPADLSAYYAEHQSSFVAPPQVQLEYLELSLAQLAEQVPITPMALEAFYHQHAAQFAEPLAVKARHLFVEAPPGSDADTSGEAREQIDDLLARLQLGESFESVAQLASTKLGRPVGEITDWLTPLQTTYPLKSPPPETLDALFALQAPDELNAVVHSSQGFHVFQLIERRAARQKDFAEVEDAVTMQYRNEMAEQRFATLQDALARLAFESPESLAPAAAQLGLTLKQTPWISSQAPPAPIDGNVDGGPWWELPMVRMAAFSSEVLEQDLNSELISLPGDRCVVLRKKAYQAARPQDFEAVKSTIEAHLLTQGAQAHAQQVADQIFTELKQGRLPHQATQAFELDWVVKKGITRADPKGLPLQLLKTVFAMERPSPGEMFPMQSLTLPNGNRVVIALSKVLDSEKPDIETAAKELATLRGQYEYQAYQNQLVTEAHIQYMPESP